LIFQVNLAKQNDMTNRRRGVKPLHTTIYLVVAVFFVALLVVSVAWVSPQPPLSQIGVKFNTSSMHNVDPKKNWFNIFSMYRINGHGWKVRMKTSFCLPPVRMKRNDIISDHL